MRQYELIVLVTSILSDMQILRWPGYTIIHTADRLHRLVDEKILDVSVAGAAQVDPQFLDHGRSRVAKSQSSQGGARLNAGAHTCPLPTIFLTGCRREKGFACNEHSEQAGRVLCRNEGAHDYGGKPPEPHRPQAYAHWDAH